MSHRKHRRLRNSITSPRVRWLVAATALKRIVLAMLRWSPHAPIADRFPLSTGVWSADGELLRITRSADDQYRLWVPLAQISPALVDAFLLKEDRWFYWHFGVNPIALGRAAFRSYTGSTRQGGSTSAWTCEGSRPEGDEATTTDAGAARPAA